MISRLIIRNFSFPIIVFYIITNSVAAAGIEIQYDLDLEFHPRQLDQPALITGTNNIMITNRWRQSIGEVYLHNNANGYFSAKDDKSPYTKIGEIRSTRLGKVIDKENISMKIGLFPELKPGESVIIEVPFSTRISWNHNPFVPTAGTRGDTTVYNLIYFYPVLEFFHDDGWHTENHDGKADPHTNLAEYKVNLTFPAEYTVATSAYLLRSDTLKNRTVKQDLVYPRATSFSVVASTQFVKQQTEIGNIKVNLLYTPGEEQHVRSLLSNLQLLIPFYEEQFGQCPNDILTITIGYSLNANALTTSNYIIFHGSLQGDYILEHEVAHQWFGNAILADESYETWLNESFAEYAAWNYNQFKLRLEKKTGFKSGLDLVDFWSDLRAMKMEDWLRLAHDVVGDRAIPAVYQPGKQTNWESQAQIYSKYVVGNYALQMLQSATGERVMKEIMQTYTRENLWKPVNTETFIAVVNGVAGKRIADNFRLALTTGLRPDFKITDVAMTSGKDRQWTTTITTDYIGEWVLPVDILAITTPGDTVVRRQVNLSRDNQIQISTADKIVSIELDPEKKMFDYNRYNNRWPRRIAFQPIYGLPSWDVYKLYYRPRIFKDWLGDWRYGVRLSGSLGLNLMPILPAVFQNAFSLDLTFSTGRPDYNWGGLFVYRTPLKSIDYMYWEFRTSYEYPRNRQSLSLITYLGKPSYFIVSGKSAYHQLTTKINRTEYIAADSTDWWSTGRTLHFIQEYIKFFYSQEKRSVVRASYLAGQSFNSEQSKRFFRFTSAVDWERHVADRIIVRVHSETGFIWDDRDSDVLRYQIKYTPQIWKDRENFIPLFRGFSVVDKKRWNSVFGLGLSFGLETNIPVWPMIYLDGAIVSGEKGSIPQRLKKLSAVDPLYLTCGLGLESQSIMEIGLYFPFWVSHPATGKTNWGLRVIVQLGFYF